MKKFLPLFFGLAMSSLVSAQDSQALQPSMHSNGITITCLGMEDGEFFEVAGIAYIVVYSKEDAVKYASKACTSNMTDMSRLFFNNHEFNEEIYHWDTSSVVKMNEMFFDAKSFNTKIAHWDVSKVQDMWVMFDGAKSFKQNISGWDVSSVLDAGGFRDNSGLPKRNSPKFDKEKSTDCEI